MGVQADTATAVEGSLLYDADGFTGGDPQQGIPPTQVSASFLNSVCDEINTIIDRCGDAALLTEIGDAVEPVAFNSAQQAGAAIRRRTAFQDGYSPGGSFPAWYRRTYESNGSSVDQKWCTWFRNSSRVAATQNTVQTSGHLVVPDNSVFVATFEVCVVRSDLITAFKVAVLRAVCRRASGICLVDQLTVVDSYGTIVVGLDVIATTYSGTPAVAVETTLPVSVGNTFNIAVSLQAANVTLGT